MKSPTKEKEIYRAVMKVRGQFDGTPIKLGYQFEIVDGRIGSMEVVDAD